MGISFAPPSPWYPNCNILQLQKGPEQRGKRPGQVAGAAWPHRARTATHGIIARCPHHGSITAPLSPTGGAGRPRDPVAGNTCPALPPPWWPEFNLACGARPGPDANLVSREMPGQEAPAPPPIPIAFPQMCGTPLFPYHVTALCPSRWSTNGPDYSRVLGRKMLPALIYICIQTLLLS